MDLVVCTLLLHVVMRSCRTQGGCMDYLPAIIDKLSCSVSVLLETGDLPLKDASNIIQDRSYADL